MKRPIIVLGASGHGKVVAEVALSAAREVVGFADGDPAKRSATVLGRSVVAVGADEVIGLALRLDAEVVLGVGSNAARPRLRAELEAAGCRFATLVHPSAVVSPTARIGSGTVVMAGVIVQAEARVGRDVILNTGCTIDHDDVLGDFVHVSPGAHLGGTVTVGEGTHIGIGASVRNNLRIGAWSTIGAGAAVVRDIPDRVVAFGVPARVIRPA